MPRKRTTTSTRRTPTLANLDNTRGDAARRMQRQRMAEAYVRESESQRKRDAYNAKRRISNGGNGG